MSRLAVRTPDEALSFGSPSMERKYSPGGAARSIEEYRADLGTFQDAGLDVVEYEGAALVGGAYLVDEATSTYETTTVYGVRSFPYRSASHLLAEYLSDEWNAIEASRSAVLRERRLDRKDDARRVLYEAYVDDRVAKGAILPDGGTKEPRASGFHGVVWAPSVRRWSATVLRPQIPGVPSKQSCRRAGFHDTRVEAAIAFDRMNVLMRGRYARTNFPVGSVFVPGMDGGYALAPDGSRHVEPMDDDRASRLAPEATAPMAAYWEERFAEVDPASMPERLRAAVLAMHETSRDYRGLAPYEGGATILADLCMPSIEHLVETMNAYRRKRMMTPVERREFPVDLTRLRRLAREYKTGHRKIVPHPSRRLRVR